LTSLFSYLNSEVQNVIMLSHLEMSVISIHVVRSFDSMLLGGGIMDWGETILISLNAHGMIMA